MIEKEEMQGKAFEIIAVAGTAKSMYIEALQLAKKKEFIEATKLIKEADEIYSEAHSSHFDLVQKESQGTDLPFSILFMHAEDQLLNTETIKIMVLEFIELYQKMD